MEKTKSVPQNVPPKKEKPAEKEAEPVEAKPVVS
jgi:hypothetical protein